LHKCVFTSAKAKNSKNQQGFHDLMDVIVEWTEPEVNRSERTMSRCQMSNYKGRVLMVVLAEGCVPLCQSKNRENQQKFHDLMDGMVELIKQEVNRHKRGI
jgi:hypothetical protein